MRIVIAAESNKRLTSDRSLDGIKRYVIEDDELGSTQIFNSIYYTLDHVKKVFYNGA